MMLKFALRNLLRHKPRTAMTLVTIIFGVVGIILSGGFVEDIFVQLRDATIHSRLGHLQVYRTGYYAHGRRDPYEYIIGAPALIMQRVRDAVPVKNVMQRLNFSGLLNNGTTDLPIIGEGVEPDKEAQLGSFLFLVEGRQLVDTDQYATLVGEGVAKSLRLKPGDFITLLATTRDGALNSTDVEVVGVFRTFSKDYDARAIRLPLPIARELLAIEGVHSLVVSLDDTDMTNSVAAALRAALGSEYEVKTWLELDDFYPKTVAMYKRQFGVLELIILFVVLLGVANTVNMTAYERVGELGTLRALGHKSADVFRLLVLENTILGLIGAVLGVIIGVVLAWGISKVGIPMPPPPNSSMGYTAYVRILPVILVTAFFVGLLATVLSAVFAARGASRVSIVDALRQNI